MENILREILSKDKSILCRRDELIAELEKKVPSNMTRELNPIKKAISLNIGENFFVGESDKSATTDNVIKILKNAGMQAARINFVVETFTEALDWNKPLIPVSMQKKSVAENSEENTIEEAPTEEISEPPSPPQTFYDIEDCISDYNALAEKSGYELKQAREEFVSKYNVRAFKCTNFEARMENHALPPKFTEATMTFGGEYWAVPVQENKFFVFPNIKTYTDDFHAARAMGEIFKSDFKAGTTYEKITVNEPAVFECAGTVWNLKIQGILHLTGKVFSSSEQSENRPKEKIRVEAPPRRNLPPPPRQENYPQTLPPNHKTKIFTTEGRLNRLAYFLQNLKLLVMLFIGGALAQIYIGVPILLAAIVGGWMVGIRRLHDLDKSGWFLLIALIPYVNTIFELYLLFAPGTRGVNRYGADPLME